jgi:hypothetical protein
MGPVVAWNMARLPQRGHPRRKSAYDIGPRRPLIKKTVSNRVGRHKIAIEIAAQSGQTRRAADK